jgi:hypothetical protein
MPLYRFTRKNLSDTQLLDCRDASAVHNIQHAYNSTGASVLLSVPVVAPGDGLPDVGGSSQGRKPVFGLVTLGWKGSTDQIFQR